jgi:hypothetical protein
MARGTSDGALGTNTTEMDRTALRTTVFPKKIEISIPESSMLEGPSNYQVWSFKVSKILERYRLWSYCTNPALPPGSISDVEIEGRAAAIQTIIESTKDSLVTTLERFNDPYLW